MSYGDSLPEIDREDRVLFVDFSLKAKELQELAMRCASITIIDHHKTAEKELQDFRMSNVDIYFDMNESGASLAWKTFFPEEEMPLLIRYIKDRDLWLFKEEHSEEINSYIQSFPMTIENYEELYDELENSDGRKALLGGRSILRYKQTMVETMCKNAKLKELGRSGYKIPVVNASILFSEVGNELCKMYPQALFSAYYFDRLADNTRQWGLRSIGDFDVSEVAKEFGGGGHKNAAGFIEKL